MKTFYYSHERPTRRKTSQICPANSYGHFHTNTDHSSWL
jgi:hypothetical protein